MNFTDKIYVAGHLGLVGSAITKSLRAKGYHNIAGRSIHELNLLDQRAVNDFFMNEKPDYVVLAAAKVGGIVANNTYRGQFIYENLQIQNNVIHQAYLSGVKKLLFLGSTCIYPKEAPQPMPENCLLTGELEYTNEPYAIAKIAGLKMCESYNLQYGTNFIAAMPTNLYGPNDNFDLEKSHVLPALIRKMFLGKCLENGQWDAIRNDLLKRPVEGISENADISEMENILNRFGVSFSQKESVGVVKVWGTGNPMREFLWSEDMADVCVYLLQNINFRDLADLRTSEIRNSHINIGTGIEISIKDLAHTIKKIVGYNGKIEFDTTKPDGTMKKLTDPSKINGLGWKHTVDIEEGIDRLYNWYLKN